MLCCKGLGVTIGHPQGLQHPKRSFCPSAAPVSRLWNGLRLWFQSCDAQSEMSVVICKALWYAKILCRTHAFFRPRWTTVWWVEACVSPIDDVHTRVWVLSVLDYVAKDESKSTTEGLPLPTQVAVNVLSMPVVVVLITGNVFRI